MSAVTFAGCFAISFPSSSGGRRAAGPRSSIAICDPTFPSACGCCSAAGTLTRDSPVTASLGCRCCGCEADYDCQHPRSCD